MAVSVKQKIQEHWDELLGAAVNHNAFGDFSLLEKGTALNIYLNDESGWTLVISRNGTWSMQ